MIKVNLLKNQQRRAGVAGEATQIGNFQFGGGEDTTQKTLIKRVGLVILPVVSVYIFEWYSVGNLDSELKAVQNKTTAVIKETDALKPQLNQIESLTTEKNKITKQIDVFKDLSRKRYSSVKLLDSIQTLIPEKAWIVKLNIRENTINLEGRAVDDLVVSTFMQNIEESAFFSNVTWIDSKEVNEPQGLVKQFSIRFQLENI